nr:ATP synthase F0 subunit 8 [Yangisunda tiani]
MPQMSPMWWTFLMMMFIITMLMSMCMVYFNYNKYLEMKTSSKKMNLNWTW